MRTLFIYHCTLNQGCITSIPEIRKSKNPLSLFFFRAASPRLRFWNWACSRKAESSMSCARMASTDMTMSG